MAQLFRYDLWAKTAQGPALAGIQVYVTTQPSNTTAVPPSPLASIFSDPLGASPVTQPGVTDGFGHFAFYALAGLYTVTIAIGGVIQNVYPDQNLGNGGLNVTITGSPVAGQALVATSPTTASWQTINGTVLNYPAVPNQFLNSYTSATGMFTSAQPVLSGIGNPTSNVNFVFNANTFTRSYSVAQQWNESLVNTSLATASANFPTPAVAMMGSIWNGSTSVSDTWAFYSIVGLGANPTSIFAFEHGGSTGIASVQVPNLLVTGNATFSGIIYDNNGLPGTAGQVLSSTSSGVVWAAGGGGGSGVTSISSNGSLTVSPSTGSVVAILNLGNANTWTGLQTFTNEKINGTLADSTGSVGTSGQSLTSTVTGTLWANTSTFGFSTPGLGWFLGGESWGPVLDSSGGGAGPVTPTPNAIVAVQLKVIVPFTISKLSAYVVTGSGTGYMCAGLYSANGSTKLIDAGVNAFDTHSASQAIRNVTLGASVVIPPGVYWFAFGSTDGGGAVILHQPYQYFSVLFSGSATRVGTCANSIVAGAMPATLGTITALTYSGADQPNIPAIMFEV